MSYDVFLVSAHQDIETAKVVARRLRALKFKVRFSDKAEAPIFDSKDTRDLEKSQSLLVLWSKDAVKSDWVRAATAIGNAHEEMIIQARLDSTVPPDPYKTGKRYSLEGMTSRKLPQGFRDVIEELGARDGRSDLLEYMDLKPSDDRDREKWLTAHPSDPITISEQKRREKTLGTKPAPAKEAAAAAALMSATINSPAQTETVKETPQFVKKEYEKPLVTASSPKAAVSSAGASLAGTSKADPGINRGPVLVALGAVFSLLLFALVNRAEILPASQGLADGSSKYLATCPAGTVPRSLLNAPSK